MYVVATASVATSEGDVAPLGIRHAARPDGTVLCEQRAPYRFPGRRWDPLELRPDTCSTCSFVAMQPALPFGIDAEGGPASQDLLAADLAYPAEPSHDLPAPAPAVETAAVFGAGH